MPNSLRPVSMDLSLDVDENAFRKKPRKGLVIGAVVGMLAVFGGILVMNRAHIGSDTTPVAAAAAVAPIAPVDPPPAVPAASPAPMPTTTAAPAPTDSNLSKLNDDQKTKLAAADRALDQKSKARKKSRAASGGGSHSSPKYKSQGFTTGGNKFDPLNAGP
jgi:hypothetical protein